MTNKYQACLGGNCIYFNAYDATLYYDDNETLILEIEISPGKTFDIELELECELIKRTDKGSVFITNQDRAWEQFTAPLDPTDDIVDDIRISNVNTGPYYFTTT
jgi:hypothetical protein